MIELAYIVAFAATVSIVSIVSRRRSAGASERTDQWSRAARQAGLADVIVADGAVTARHGGLRVTIEEYQLPDPPYAGPRVVVSGLPSELEMVRGSRGDSLETGDEAFDAAIHLTGPGRLALALLDAATRAQVLDVFCIRLRIDGRSPRTLSQRVELRAGGLTVDCPERHAGDNAVMLASYLAEILKLADALLPPDALEPHLLRNLREDPEPGVRLANLYALLSEGAHEPAAREALRVALEDGDERVQTEAAVTLGAKQAHAALLDVATRAWSSDTCAARAVAALGLALPAGSTRNILERALADDLPATAQACLEFLPAEHLDLAMRALEQGQPAVVSAAARCLGRIGTVDSIPPLREAAERHRGARDAIRSAVAAIQARLQDADRGQLSLAGSDPGRVSLSQEPAGRVSLGEDPAGPD